MASKKRIKKTKVGNASGVDSKQPLENAPKDLIPIVALGASAGGLEPIEQFFDAMTVDSGCAFVIIQHLSPDFRSLMDELLARHSSMKIQKIVDGMEVVANTIYLNTPRSVMTVHGNILRVSAVEPQDTVYLPIDIFFESLAKSRKGDSIAIVLSGTGSDGTKGSTSVRAIGGTVFVQDPDTTRFDGMPSSVIASGNSTLTAAPNVLAKCVQRMLVDESLDGLDSRERRSISDPLSDVLSMLKHSHGTDFHQYKDATIYRRIERRAQMAGIKDIEDYRDFLITDMGELQELYNDLLIEVTDFFRDKDGFKALDRLVIAKLIDQRSDDVNLRVWVPGCASGEEAYSIGILLLEHARRSGVDLKLKIMATDIHVRSMSQASSGIYNESSLKYVSKEIVERYFDCADGQAQVKSHLRNMVFFSTHDVTRDPPFTRIDLIACRNLLIYLKEEAQEKVMNLLHFSLRQGGFLFLGPSEHIGAIAHEFEAVNEKWRIYKKIRDVKLLTGESLFHRTDIERSIQRGRPLRHNNQRSSNIGLDESIPFKRAHRAALESIVETHAPPGFLLDEEGEIVHIFGDAGDLMPVQRGEFSRRIVDVIMPEFKVIVTTALDHARNTQFKDFKRSAYVGRNDGPSTSYEISLKPVILQHDPVQFLLLTVQEIDSENKIETPSALVTAEEVAAFDSSEILRKRISILEHSLQSSEESLQSTIEELETTNEELQSTNEELMATNEELQSTNEELHSVNEELYTVSAEHQRKNEELVERDNDITVLLEQSKIGTIHLDEELNLRRYTANSRSVFNILPQDVGRPFKHITYKDAGCNLYELVTRANQNHQIEDLQVHIDEKVYLVRVLPYQRDHGESSSVLITTIDITDFETIRSKLNELNLQYLQYEDILERTDTFFVRWDAETSLVKYCNSLYSQRWGLEPADIIGTSVFDIYSQSEQEELKQSLLNFSPSEIRTSVESYQFQDGETRWANVSKRAISHDGESIVEFQVNGQDATADHNYRLALKAVFNLVTDSNMDFDEKIKGLLEAGREYYSLDTGLLTTVTGKVHRVVGVVSKTGTDYSIGDQLDDGDTAINSIVEKEQSFSIERSVDYQFPSFPDGVTSSIESLVGAAVNTASGPYGTVYFCSSKLRNRHFNTRDEGFALLISSWVGFLVEYREQTEFITKQVEHYQSVFQNVPVMMFLCDEEGLIFSASDRLCEKLGCDSDQLPGKNCLGLFSEHDSSAVKEALTQGNVLRLPLTIPSANKNAVEIEMYSRVKPSGTLRGVRMVVLIDVSDRNRALRDSEDQNRRLEVANEHLNQFAFIASHDLQEPLRKIQQFSSFLEADLGEGLGDDGRYHLETIVDASARMSTLIFDLLRYSGASKDDPTIESVALSELLVEVVAELELSIEESNADIQIGELPTVEGDRGLVRQLLVNLVSNSIKYRDPERSPKITINAFKEGKREGIKITDNGIGIDMKYAKKIFEPFNRLHGPTDYKGNGIGLAICSTVCDKHNWRLSVESSLGSGSTFIIEFAQ